MRSRARAVARFAALLGALTVGPAFAESCTVYVPGASVTLHLETAPMDDGTEAVLVLQELELVRCSDPRLALAPTASPRSDGPWWNALLPSKARAHGLTTPTQLGLAEAVSLTGPAGSVDLGLLEPPATAYCALRVKAGPADADATGTTIAPGTSLRLSTASGEVTSASTRERLVGLDEALTLDAGRLHHRIMLKPHPGRWLAATDTELSRAVRSARVLERALATLEIAVQPL